MNFFQVGVDTPSYAFLQLSGNYSIRNINIDLIGDERIASFGQTCRLQARFVALQAHCLLGTYS